MGQKWVLQAREAVGFWCTKQPKAGRPPARHCTALVCTPPPQLAVHWEKHMHSGHLGPPGSGAPSLPLHPDSSVIMGKQTRLRINPMCGQRGQVLEV